jgi:cytidylate kinase
VGVVTVSRQYGAGGRRVAPALALGYRLVDREVIEEAAARLGVDPELARDRDERAPALVEQLGMALARGTPEFGLAEVHLDDRELAAAVRSVIESLANAGGYVILGRGGQAVLREHPDVCHLSLIGTIDDRAGRVAASQLIGMDEARDLCRRMDAERAGYVRRFSGVDIDDPLLYDAILNTSTLRIEGATQTALAACRARLGPDAG